MWGGQAGPYDSIYIFSYSLYYCTILYIISEGVIAQNVQFQRKRMYMKGLDRKLPTFSIHTLFLHIQKKQRIQNFISGSTHVVISGELFISENRRCHKRHAKAKFCPINNHGGTYWQKVFRAYSEVHCSFHPTCSMWNDCILISYGSKILSVTWYNAYHCNLGNANWRLSISCK